MKELWQCLGFLGLVTSILIIVAIIIEFFNSINAHLRGRKYQTIYKEFTIGWLSILAILGCIGTIGSACIYFQKSWEHINTPREIGITVSPNTIKAMWYSDDATIIYNNDEAWNVEF